MSRPGQPYVGEGHAPTYAFLGVLAGLFLGGLLALAWIASGAM